MLLFSESDHLLYLAKAAFPQHLVQYKVIDGEFGLVVLPGNSIQRLLFCQRLRERPADVSWSVPRNALQLCRRRQVREQEWETNA